MPLLSFASNRKYDDEKFSAIMDVFRRRGVEYTAAKLSRRVCDTCDRHAPIIDSAYLVCGRCLKKHYCCPDCQRRDWDEGHKDVCEEAPPR